MKAFRYVLMGFSLFQSICVAAPQFTQGSFQFRALVDRPFRLALSTLLVKPEAPDQKWSFRQLPAWLTYDAHRIELVGTPTASDIGDREFQAVVMTQESGALTMIGVQVMAYPTWKRNPIDLGTQTEGSGFSFDLKREVWDQDGSPITFSAQNLPRWMSLSAAGILSGTPAKADVGSCIPVSPS